ncbi:hypothetical protein [Duganella vulcania]|uniref:Uncharacterized protein n=1 Tax=Duganella vulcania TaxID=2692166 RepID=A0A845GF67_9BURK|nr:hypothetical protein [Duganella vulcania]MYM92571.1 hypothetical protein [Duganella vulcania]
MLINEVIEVGGRQWKVRQAVSHEAALNEIAMARCTGSIGGKSSQVIDGVETVLANVVRLNSDGTETKAYSGY